MGASPQLGRVFDHYRLLEKLGEGGMGVVWLAEDTRLGRKVALKFLPPEAARDAVRRQRFEQEARAAATLSHPGIATVHELAETEGQTCIVFEYVPGSTLRSRVAPGGLPCDELLDIAGDIANALAAAHAAGVVHRDLKPENVMRTPAGDCKVMDFGLARLSAQAAPDAATESHLTRAGMVVGTVGYMAPEQLEGKEIDFRCDIFSFGTLVYELATGVHPFQGGSSASTIAAIMTAEPLPLTQRNRLQPPELERIVRKCLRKRREERYQSTRDLAVDLRTLQHGTRSAEAAVAQPPRTTMRTWWWIHNLSPVVALPLCLAVAWIAYQSLTNSWAAGVFLGEVVAIAVSFSLRALVIFFAVFDRPELPHHLRRLRPWQRPCDVLLCTGFFIMAAGLFPHPGLTAFVASWGTMGLLLTQVAEPLVDRGAFPAELVRHNADQSEAPSRLRLWWWWHNLISCCVVAPLMVYLAWLGWHEATLSWGRAAFMAQVVTIGFMFAARITLLFFAFFEVPDFALNLQRFNMLQPFAVLIWACGAAALAVPLSDAHIGLAATLASLAIAGLGASFVEPAIARGAFPQAFTPTPKPISSVAPRQRPSKLRRWWWGENLAGCCVTAPLLVYLAWLGWHEAWVSWGKSVFVAVVVGVGLNVGVRVTFLVFAFVELPDFTLYLRRHGVWQRIGMFIGAAGLGILAVPLSEAHVGLAATLAALAIGVVAGSELVEPAMARGAFPETGNHKDRDR